MERNYALDIAKIFALFFIAWGHFVSASTFGIDKNIIMDSNSLPLLPPELHSLWKIEAEFHNLFNVYFAIIGLIIFFIIHGMFIPDMQQKYCDKKFLKFNLFLHCFSRVFPTLLFATILIIVIEKFLQGITFPNSVILATITGIPGLFKSSSVTGVIWFLSVLEITWLISCFISKYTIKNTFIMYFFYFLIIVLSHYINNSLLHDFMAFLAYNVRMIGIINIGIMLNLTKNLTLKKQIFYVGICIFLSVITLNTYENLYKFKETYDNILSYVFAFLVIYFGHTIYSGINKIKFENIKVKIISLISFISKLFLPFYLIHVSVGLNVIFLLRKIDINPAVCVLSAYIMSFLLSFILYKISGLVSSHKKKIKEL